MQELLTIPEIWRAIRDVHEPLFQGQTVRAKLRIYLTLTIHDGSDIAEQIGQMLFTPLAASRGVRIETDDPLR